MTFLPIVTRELRLAARRPGTYWWRTGAGLGALVWGAFLMAMTMQMGAGMGGRFVLFLVARGFALFCLFAGCRVTADALSGEKREDTLGLLFLTDLKAYDIVLGRLAAGALRLLFPLLATVPILAVPLLQGGVGVGDIAPTALALLNILFFACSLGLAVSAVSRHAQRATTAAVLLVVWFYFVMPWLAGSGWPMPTPLRFLVTLMVYASPYTPLAHTTDIFGWTTIGFNLGSWWLPLLTSHLVGWLFLGAACWWLPRSWQTRPAGVARLRWRDRWRRWGLGDFAKRARRRRHMLDQGAFYWLAARDPWRRRLTWFWSGLLLALFLLAFWKEKGGDPSLTFSSLVLFHLVLKFWIASASTAHLTANRSANAFELLLATPLTVPDILHGERRALRRQFTVPLSLALLSNTCLLVAIVGQRWLKWWDPSNDMDWESIAVAAGSGVALVVDAVALSWTGMWTAISQRNLKRATSEAVLRIMVLPWALLIIGFTTVGFMQVALGRPFNFSYWWVFAVWLVLGVVNDVAFTLWSRHQLLHRFRVKAEGAYEPALPGWLRGVIRWLARSIPRRRAATGG